MKIYGYHMGSRGIEAFTVEVTEKPKTLIADGGFFPFIYNRRLSKDDIGCVVGLGRYKDTVYLLEPNAKEAKQVFVRKMEKEAETAKRAYDEAVEKLEMLKAWDVEEEK